MLIVKSKLCLTLYKSDLAFEIIFFFIFKSCKHFITRIEYKYIENNNFIIWKHTPNKKYTNK